MDVQKGEILGVLGPNGSGETTLFNLLTGGLICVLFALVISLALFRMSGVYFAIGSWIVAEALMIWFSNWGYTKKGMGMFIKAAYQLSINQIYYAAILLGIASVALTYFLLRSKLGLGLMAMRDDEGACRGYRCQSLSVQAVLLFDSGLCERNYSRRALSQPGVYPAL